MKNFTNFRIHCGDKIKFCKNKMKMRLLVSLGGIFLLSFIQVTCHLQYIKSSFVCGK
jgi:hypothetical protein